MANQIKLKRGSGSDPSASDLDVGEVAIRTDNGKLFTKKDNGTVSEITGGGGIDDGDKGDITVSNSGATFTIDNGVITSSKIASGAVGSTQLAQGAVTNSQLGDDAVDANKLANPISLPDDHKISFGTGSDNNLEIFHESSSNVNEIIAVDGEIHIQADNFMLISDDTAGRAIYLDNSSGHLELGFDGNHCVHIDGSQTEFIKDVKFDGATAGRDIVFDRSDNAFEFADNATAKFGSSDTLEIYHDGSNAYIDSPQNDTLFIRNGTTGGKIKIQGNSGEDSIICNHNGSVELYEDNTKRLETTDAGISVTGNIAVSGTVDGRDLATDGSKLDGIASGATNVTNTNQLTNGAGFITATLTNEQVQDIVGNMVTGNTESGITVTYQDGDGTLDFSVASQTDQNFTTTLKNKLDGIAAGATNVTNTNQLTNGAGFITSADGGNAATLDGIDSSQFLRSDTDDTISAALTTKILKFTGVGGNSNNSVQDYAIYQESGAWSAPFPDLVIGYHTGIKIGGHKSYNGTRFYNDAPGRSGASELFSVGNGDDHVRVANHLFVAGVIYVDNTTNYLAHPTGDYGSVQINGSGKGSYEGFSIDGRMVFMHDGGNNTGIYNDVDNEWHIYLERNGMCRLYHNGSGKLDTTSTGIDVTGRIDINDTNTRVTEGDSNSIRLQTNSGYIDVGAQNTSYAHFTTDRSQFYFGRKLQINGNCEPYGNHDLGASNNRWQNLYVNDLQLSNESSGGNSVDGTWGDWTLQEGEDTIFMLNNRNGKKYKMNLTEVS